MITLTLVDGWGDVCLVEEAFEAALAVVADTDCLGLARLVHLLVCSPLSGIGIANTLIALARSTMGRAVEEDEVDVVDCKICHV